MFTKEQLERLKNDEGNFSEPDVKAVEKMTGKTFSDVVAEAETQQAFTINGEPVTRKEQVSNANDRAKYFEALREQGRNPKEEFNNLQ